MGIQDRPYLGAAMLRTDPPVDLHRICVNPSWFAPGDRCGLPSIAYNQRRPIGLFY
jgi:hypothetical protein